MDVGERYKYLVDALTGGDQKSFCVRCGLNYSAFNRIINGKSNFNPLSKKYINAIIDTYPEVSRNWLLTGEGEPGVSIRSNLTEELKKQIIEKDRLIDELLNQLATQRKIIEKLLG